MFEKREYNVYEDYLDIQEKSISIFDLNQKYEKKRILASRSIQRNESWSDKKKSKFIESIILNIPIPFFLMQEDKNGGYILIDGLQRLNAINDYLNNKFKLTELENLIHLNGKSFKDIIDLSPCYKNKVEDKRVIYYSFKNSISYGDIQDVFDRINTSYTTLMLLPMLNFTGKL